MNRRGFLGTLLAGAVAAIAPVKAKPEVIDLWKTDHPGFKRATAPGLPKDLLCQKAPTGWRCTRVTGHDGPCAA